MSDEPGWLGARIRTEALGYLVSGDVGQPKVAQHEVEALLVGGGEPVATGVDDCHVVAPALQQSLVGTTAVTAAPGMSDIGTSLGGTAKHQVRNRD